jgi:hypothetical protein
MPAPCQFQPAVDMRKWILFHSLIYSPSFSATEARRRIQSRDTLWTSPKVRLFHTYAIASSISSLEENSRSLRICFDTPKNQKLHGLISGEYGGCGILEMWFFLIYDIRFDLLWYMGLFMCTQKVDPVFWRRKIRFTVFKSGNMFLMKYGWLNGLPHGRTSCTISFCAMKNAVIIVFSRQLLAAASEWHLLPNGQTFSKMLWCVETRTRRLLRCYQNHLFVTHAKSLTILLLPQHAWLFEYRWRHEGLVKACLTPWFSFGKSVITLYIPKLYFMLLNMRIPVRSRAHWDRRGAGDFLDALY